MNYPAREFGIKRGDSFETIRDKSGGRCASLHLPVIPVSTRGDAATAAAAAPSSSFRTATANTGGVVAGGAEAGDVGEGGEESSLETAYAAEFRLSPEVRGGLFARERDRMRSPREGKASLERYRLASAAIFRAVGEALAEAIGVSGDFVLERASIDELFLDVTSICYHPSRPAWRSVGGDPSGAEENGGSGGGVPETDPAGVSDPAMSGTVVCGSEALLLSSDESSHEETRALQRGCAIAYGIRKAVRDKLGFTLSAGVSFNKMMAKLGASYGKPNGQAVIYPVAVPQVRFLTLKAVLE